MANMRSMADWSPVHHVSFVSVVDLDLCDILPEVDSPIGIEASLAFPLVKQLGQLTGLIC